MTKTVKRTWTLICFSLIAFAVTQELVQYNVAGCFKNFVVLVAAFQELCFL